MIKFIKTVNTKAKQEEDEQLMSLDSKFANEIKMRISVCKSLRLEAITEELITGTWFDGTFTANRTTGDIFATGDKESRVYNDFLSLERLIKDQNKRKGKAVKNEKGGKEEREIAEYIDNRNDLIFKGMTKKMVEVRLNEYGSNIHRICRETGKVNGQEELDYEYHYELSPLVDIIKNQIAERDEINFSSRCADEIKSYIDRCEFLKLDKITEGLVTGLWLTENSMGTFSLKRETGEVFAIGNEDSLADRELLALKKLIKDQNLTREK